MWCFTFLILDAVQAVYCGGIFQKIDSFGFGAIVFGAPAGACLAWTWALNRRELGRALAARGDLAGLNVTAAGAWIAYLIAIQLIEPAVAFTLFSGAIPLAALGAAFVAGRGAAPAGHGRMAWLATGLIAAGMAAVAAVTLIGWSGFVRGGAGVAVAGLALAALAGVLITGMLICSARLDRAGVGPLAQFGLRFPLYVALSLAGFALGLDAKDGAAVAPGEFLVALAVGLAVLAFPIYAVQKAVSLTSTRTIAAFAAAGPLVVFVLQMVEGRVAYSAATLTGLIVYFAGALIGALAGALAGVQSQEPA